jgi:transcriptional regulator with XRE-family HTH domain
VSIGRTQTDSAALTAAEFRVAREALGVTGDWLAARLSVTDRQVRRWEAGTTPVPAGVADELRGLADAQDAFVDAVIEALREDGPDHVDGQAWVTVYPSDTAYLADHPDSPWSAGWHRTAMGLVADELEWVRLHWVGTPDE